MRTKNEFVQRGDYEDDEEEGYDAQDTAGGQTEDEVMLMQTSFIAVDSED